MTFSTSEKRLTRSQARAGSSMVSTKTPNGSSTPSSSTQCFSKAGRRVLAELACNDSPVVGLLPAGTPKDKSSDGGPVRSRRSLLTDMAPTHPACTPLGESLLRSQVQLLLQKVEAGMCAVKAPALHMGNVLGASPTMLAAPTPLNTPASVVITQIPHPGTQCDIGLPSQPVSMDVDANMQDAGVPSSLNMSGQRADLHDVLDLEHGALPSETHSSLCLTTLSTEVLPQFPLEVSDVPSSTEIFIGKRVLHFGDDTPCQSLQEKSSSRVFFSEETEHSTPAMRQLEDDEVSEWSVNVNVGSPLDKQSLVEVAEGTSTGDTASNVHLLWDEDTGNVVIQSRRILDRPCEDVEDEDEAEDGNSEEYSEAYFYEEEDEGSYEGEECHDLCDMFRDMGFAEESKGLPRGEGEHLRFLYEEGDDEFVEAMVVKGEEDVGQGGVAIRLKGLPAPLGRHWRFAQDEDEKDEGSAS